MCIRDRQHTVVKHYSTSAQQSNATKNCEQEPAKSMVASHACLLYTSDAADERSSVDLGGRRIIKKKKKRENQRTDLVKTK